MSAKHPEFLPPAHVAGLAPYQPGKPIEELERELGLRDIVKLASNENPLGPSPRALEAARRAAGTINLYPDGGGHRLRLALAGRLGVTPDELVLGSGSNDLIDLLVRAFCRPGVDEVLSYRHAFVMYKVACHTHGVTYREADVRPDLGADVDALLGAVTARTRIVFLPNPNNPTGLYSTRAELERLLAGLPPEVLLVVDEAYQEFATRHADYPVAERHRAGRPLLVTLRTFSKAHGLAGLRVGYAVGPRSVVSYLDRVRLPFNVGSVAQEAALAALGDEEHVARTVAANAEGLALLLAELPRTGARVWPSAGNFVLVDVGRDAGPVYDALLRKGIIVRPLRPYGLPHHLRITIGTQAENRRLVTALGEVLG